MTATPQDRLTALDALPDNVTIDVDGKSITLPNLAKVKPGVIRKATKNGANDFEIAWNLLEALADADTLEVIYDLDPKPFGKLCQEWQQGASLGESVSSEN